MTRPPPAAEFPESLITEDTDRRRILGSAPPEEDEPDGVPMASPEPILAAGTSGTEAGTDALEGEAGDD